MGDSILFVGGPRDGMICAVPPHLRHYDVFEYAWDRQATWDIRKQEVPEVPEHRAHVRHCYTRVEPVLGSRIEVMAHSSISTSQLLAKLLESQDPDTLAKALVMGYRPPKAESTQEGG